MGTAILVSLVFGLIAGAVGIFLMISAMKTVRANNTASDYKRPNSLHLSSRSDMFLYRKVNKTRRQTEQK